MENRDKEIYVLNLDFSKMRFLDDNSGTNTTVISDYSLISLNKQELKEVLPEIRDLFHEIMDKYGKKYQFLNEK
jgi:arsenate reductase-like glutaredoxin family protein